MQATLERDSAATATPATRDAGRVDIDQRIDRMEIHYNQNRDRIYELEARVSEKQWRGSLLRNACGAGAIGSLGASVGFAIHPIYNASRWPMACIMVGSLLAGCTAYFGVASSGALDRIRCKELREENDIAQYKLSMSSVKRNPTSKELDGIQQQLSGVRRDVEGMLKE